MTAKEKAAQLFNKFAQKFIDSYSDYWREPSRECVIITVNEILDTIDWHEYETPNDMIEFWSNVKIEIEKI